MTICYDRDSMALAGELIGPDEVTFGESDLTSPASPHRGVMNSDSKPRTGKAYTSCAAVGKAA